MYNNWLRSFYAVARAGGFTAASRVLEIGQPTITSQVRALEDKFKVELFYRRGRKVEITKAGRELLGIAQGIFGHEEEAIRYLNAIRDLQTGQFAISAITPFVAVQLVEAFHKKFSDIRIDLFIGHADDVLKSLLDFRSDVGVLSHFEQDRNFIVRPYFRSNLVTIVNVNHPWANRRQISIKDLRAQKLIMREPTATTRQILDRVAKRAKVPLDTFMEVNSREGLFQAVMRGLGIGVISAIEAIPLKGIKPIPFTDSDMHVQFYITALRSRRQRPLIDGIFKVADELASVNE